MATDPLKLCMLSGSFEYDSERSLRRLETYLASRFDVETTLIVYRDEDDDPSLAPIDETDVLLVFTRRLNTSGPELERFQAYCAAGRPIVGIRTASHGFQNWLAFDKEVLGGNYDGHYGGGPLCQVSVAPGAERHPVLRDVLSFTSEGSLYKNTPIADDATLLLVGRTADGEEPVAWIRRHRGGRVFYTSLGHQSDFLNPNFLRLIENAVLWAGGRLDSTV